MSRNLTYFNNNRIVYKRNPITDKPTYTDRLIIQERIYDRTINKKNK